MSAARSPRPVVVDTSNCFAARLRPVPLDAIALTDAFWEPRRRVNREQSLPAQHRHLEETGRIDNFRRVSGRKAIAAFQGTYSFNDSDVYKWIEAASWTLGTDDAPELKRLLDDTIAEVAAAQQPDGYLNTWFALERADQRYTKLKDSHELYCAGHLMQAAVAHYRCTGEPTLIEVACNVADHLCDTFGPAAEGKREQTDGHPEIEMALVELYRAAGDERYLKLAQFLLDIRGRGGVGGDEYHQDHKPFRELDRVTGHAVRCIYYACGATDIFAETDEEPLRDALERLWQNMTTAQMYVTGGLGSRWDGEAFGRDYELPNERAYAETCAAIASVMWNQRMLALAGEARFADVIELALYNGVLASLSLDGQSYFYQNPLADDGTHRRQPWFGCACCPPNVARLLAYLPGLFYSVTGDCSIFVHLYADGAAELDLDDGRTITLRQRTRYPWDGQVTIELDAQGLLSIYLRIPAWVGDRATIDVNGHPLDLIIEPGTYLAVRQLWQPGDTVHLNLPMPARLIESHPHVAANAGRLALARGPLIYCVESADNPGIDPRDLVIAPDAEFDATFRPDLLGGVAVLQGRAQVAEPDGGWDGNLYRPISTTPTLPGRSVELTAIPNYAWANREPGRMQVWMRRQGR